MTSETSPSLFEVCSVEGIQLELTRSRRLPARQIVALEASDSIESKINVVLIRLEGG